MNVLIENLMEGKVWNGGRIQDMSIQHIYRTLAWLEENALSLQRSYANDTVWVGAPDEVHDEVEMQMRRKPDEWLRSMPLYRNLVRRARDIRKGRA